MPSKFHKRHYVAIADMLARDVAPVINKDAFGGIISSFVAMFKADNPKFAADYFREYVERQRVQRMEKLGNMERRALGR